MRVFFISILLILAFFHTHGVIVHDEGYILQSSLKFLNGLLPYRDFHFVYTPGSIYLTSLALFFSKSILATKILMLVWSFLTCIVLYKTIIIATKNKFYGILSVLMYIAWGPTHINFAWPVMFCISLGILLCYLLLRFYTTNSERFLYLAGVVTFLIFLFKQNFGAAGLFIPFLFFVLSKQARSFSSILAFIYGYLWSTLVFAIYLLATNSFAPFLSDFYFFTIKRIIFQNDLSTPLIFYDSPIRTAGRAFTYLLPLISALSTVILLFIRRRFYLLHFPFFVLLFYIVGIRPTTDYIHLVPLLSLTGISIVMFLRFNIYSTLKVFILIATFILILLGFYTALFKGYYRWQSPLINHNNFYDNQKVRIYVDERTKNDFDIFLDVVNKNSKQTDYIFVNSYEPIFYFISERLEPTKNNYLTIDVDANIYEKEAISNLSSKKIPLVLIKRGSTDRVASFVKSNYNYFSSFGDYDVYKKLYN